MQVESLCQWLKEKHHHRELLPVATTASTRCKGQGTRCKILSWSVVVVAGVVCCCCIPLRLVRMLVLTFAPCTLTIAPCTYSGCHQQQFTVVVFLTQPLAQRLHWHMWWFHSLQLALVVFFLPPTGTDTGLTLGQLYITYYGLRVLCMFEACLYVPPPYVHPRLSLCPNTLLELLYACGPVLQVGASDSCYIMQLRSACMWN